MKKSTLIFLIITTKGEFYKIQLGPILIASTPTFTLSNSPPPNLRLRKPSILSSRHAIVSHREKTRRDISSKTKRNIRILEPLSSVIISPILSLSLSLSLSNGENLEIQNLSLSIMASMATCVAVTAKTRHCSSHHFAFFSKSSNLCSFPYSNPSPLHLRRRFASKSRDSGCVSVVRASVDVPAGIKPGNRVETDKLPTDVRKRAMDAVDSCGGRVTIGDVASKAGLKLDETQRALQALAADTNGFLEVSDEGDVLYVFPRDYRSKLASKSFRMRIEPFLEKSKGAAEYLIRVTFGTALIASIVLVYTTIIVLLSSRRYWDPYYYRRRPARTDDNGMNFIESVFSFVFGDGDPNQGIEEERWKLIGQYISSHGGVITAEELAPYLDVTEETIDESYMLPVLLRFDGQPEVDEEGNILYRFPSLQRTATSQGSRRKEYVGKRWADWVGGVERFFEEKKWQFSKTRTYERAMVIGLGGLNLFGVVVLGTMLKNTAMTPSGFISFVATIFPLLQIYAGSFFAIPLARWFFLQRTNSAIEKRNRAREKRARILEQADVSLRRKLLNARDMAQRTVIGQDRIVYSTDKDLSDQDYEARDWDRRFREIERTD
ncbi:hypothetical protein Sjap_001152 [Stephania japonica]|uniref:Iron-sulfur cluster biosynthesis family protein n=1 Tax=Stephania japonica TaxID=461633 RepID=A0AAP0KJE9_9MAGN